MRFLTARWRWTLGIALTLAVVAGGWLALPRDPRAGEDARRVRLVASPPAASVARLTVRVLSARPHDPEAFTQGLVWHAGVLFESTGLYGRSRLRRVDPRSGAVLEEVALSPALFGEGLARIDDRLVQLTWREGTALVWDLSTLRERHRHSYQGEGWGLATVDGRLVRSDGSERLILHDPETFAPAGTLRVTLDGAPLTGLNELEAAEGALWANLWQEDRIARIDPASGVVTGVVDARPLRERLTAEERARADVLNGIAYDAQARTFLLTGKFWPRLFEVRFEPAAGE